MQSIYEEFLAVRQLGGMSAGTIQQYGWHLRRFLAWLEEDGVAGLMELERAHLLRWRLSLPPQWSASYRKHAVVAVRTFLRWSAEQGHCDCDYGDVLKTPRVAMTPQRTITVEELATLLDACNDSKKGLRDAAIISLLFDSGMRRSELCGLVIEDLDFERGIAQIARRKGGKTGWAPFGGATADRLRQWLVLRDAAEGVDALFINVHHGTAITPDGLRTILRKLGKSAGVDGVSPHAFRRGWTVALFEMNASPRYMIEAGGWSNDSQLFRYSQMYEAQRKAPGLSPIDNLAQNGKSGGETIQLPLWAKMPKG